MNDQGVTADVLAKAALLDRTSTSQGQRAAAICDAWASALGVKEREALPYKKSLYSNTPLLTQFATAAGVTTTELQRCLQLRSRDCRNHNLNLMAQVRSGATNATALVAHLAHETRSAKPVSVTAPHSTAKSTPVAAPAPSTPTIRPGSDLEGFGLMDLVKHVTTLRLAVAAELNKAAVGRSSRYHDKARDCLTQLLESIRSYEAEITGLWVVALGQPR